MKRHRKLILFILFLAVLAAGSLFFYNRQSQSAQAEATPAVQTAACAQRRHPDYRLGGGQPDPLG